MALEALISVAVKDECIIRGVNLDTFRWRGRVLGSKLKGQLPGLPWTQLPGMMAQPFENWDYSYFTTRVQGSDVPDIVLYETALGRFYGHSSDQASIAGVIVEELCRVYQQPPVMVSPGDVVVDLGAHLGTFIRVALDAGAKQVVAFEANTRHAECLRMTYKSEIARKRVVLIEAPVWSEPCTVLFAGNDLVGQVGDQGDPRQAVTIDDVVRDLNISKVDFIKTDIEGAERNALRGAAHVLKSHNPKLAVSSYHYPDDPPVLREIVLGYHPYRVTFDAGNKRMFCYPRKA